MLNPASKKWKILDMENKISEFGFLADKIVRDEDALMLPYDVALNENIELRALLNEREERPCKKKFLTVLNYRLRRDQVNR